MRNFLIIFFILFFSSCNPEPSVPKISDIHISLIDEDGNDLLNPEIEYYDDDEIYIEYEPEIIANYFKNYIEFLPSIDKYVFVFTAGFEKNKVEGFYHAFIDWNGNDIDTIKFHIGQDQWKRRFIDEVFYNDLPTNYPSNITIEIVK